MYLKVSTLKLATWLNTIDKQLICVISGIGVTPGPRVSMRNWRHTRTLEKITRKTVLNRAIDSRWKVFLVHGLSSLLFGFFSQADRIDPDLPLSRIKTRLYFSPDLVTNIYFCSRQLNLYFSSQFLLSTVHWPMYQNDTRYSKCQSIHELIIYYLQLCRARILVRPTLDCRISI